MSVMRIKLKILPYEEKLCILVNQNSTVSDLKAKVFNAIQHYVIYKQYLDFCTIHLELEIDGDCYGLPQHYVLKDCLTDNDIVIVKFIDNKDFQFRSSIHIKYQTKSDLFNNQNQNQMQFSNNVYSQQQQTQINQFGGAMSPDFVMNNDTQNQAQLSQNYGQSQNQNLNQNQNQFQNVCSINNISCDLNMFNAFVQSQLC